MGYGQILKCQKRHERDKFSALRGHEKKLYSPSRRYRKEIWSAKPYTPVRFQQLLNIADCNAFSIIHPLAVFISKKAHLVTYDEYGIRL